MTARGDFFGSVSGEAAVQVFCKGHSLQSGVPEVQTIAPRSMRADAIVLQPVFGKKVSAMASKDERPWAVSIGEVMFPHRASTLMIFVSSTTACWSWANALIAAAV